MLKNLKAEMARYGVSSEQIANEIGKDERTVRSKISGNSTLTFPEAVKIHSKFFATLDMRYLFAETNTA